jgi:hypothetical protein
MSVHSNFHETISLLHKDFGSALFETTNGCNDPSLEADRNRLAAARARTLATALDEFADYLEREAKKERR